MNKVTPITGRFSNRPERGFDVPAASGKTIKEMRVYDSPPYGREVQLVLTDGTEIVVELNVVTTAVATHYKPHPGEHEVLSEVLEPEP